jgi:sensor histidine kinase YesM
MQNSYLHSIIHSKGSRFLLHLLFWLGVSAFLTFFFGHFHGDYQNTFLFVSLLVPVSMGTTYSIIYFLIPHYLLRKRYIRFFIYFLFTLIISVWVEMMLMVWALINLADYRYANMNPLTGDIFFLAVGLYFVVFFSTSVKLLKHWYSSEKDVSELRSRKLEAELKLKETELQLLKGQIHPHFLFNTLNNLYGLALEKSEQIPDAIIRLSGLLDALLYRSQTSLAPLKAEIKLMEDYIALEKLRVEERLNLKWHISENVNSYQLPPFLLFPFIENAFKHGFSQHTENLWLEVKADIKHHQLCFSVANSLSSLPPTPQKPAGGIGLQNVKRRLTLLYPDKYRLEIEQLPDKFTVRLTLELCPQQKDEEETAYANQ